MRKRKQKKSSTESTEEQCRLEQIGGQNSTDQRGIVKNSTDQKRLEQTSTDQTEIRRKQYSTDGKQCRSEYRWKENSAERNRTGRKQYRLEIVQIEVQIGRE